jgi:hypothetical protein
MVVTWLAALLGAALARIAEVISIDAIRLPGEPLDISAGLGVQTLRTGGGADPFEGTSSHARSRYPLRGRSVATEQYHDDPTVLRIFSLARHFGAKEAIE